MFCSSCNIVVDHLRKFVVSLRSKRFRFGFGAKKGAMKEGGGGTLTLNENKWNEC